MAEGRKNDVIDEEKCRNLANLCRIEIKSDQMPQMKRDISQMITFARTIHGAFDNCDSEVKEVEPTRNILQNEGPVITMKDIKSLEMSVNTPPEHIGTDKLLEMASRGAGQVKRSEGDYFLVK